jgi:hypothetical protein
MIPIDLKIFTHMEAPVYEISTSINARFDGYVWTPENSAFKVYLGNSPVRNVLRNFS